MENAMMVVVKNLARCTTASTINTDGLSKHSQTICMGMPLNGLDKNIPWASPDTVASDRPPALRAIEERRNLKLLIVGCVLRSFGFNQKNKEYQQQQ
jgi:hypothetical protein